LSKFDTFAKETSGAAGRPWAFILACGIVIVWAATGPVFRFSDTWQLVINTGTTIITFLMVFLIQATQNRDAMAIQAKLDELIRSSNAQNRFIGIDQSLSEGELRKLRGE
jgi:low affinity Fe/Cu permease